MLNLTQSRSTPFPVPEPDEESAAAGYPALVRAADFRRGYPKFYWHSVFPYVKDALDTLSATQAGQQIKASLYANVFMVEHESAADASAS